MVILAKQDLIMVEPLEYGRLRHTVRLLQEDGFGLNGKRIGFEQFINTPWQETASFLRTRLGNLISGLLILDREGPYGVFNRHDFAHLENVNSYSHLLLDQFEQQTGIKATNTERNISTAISFTHDIGNNLSRKNHGELSAGLFKKIFQGCSDDDRAVKSIIAGIRIHDEPFGTKFSDLAQAVEKFPGIYVAPVLAAVAADKLDIGRHRLSTALVGELPATFDRIIEQGPHTSVILYAKSNKLEFSADGVEAKWKIGFSTSIEENEEEATRHILGQFIWKGKDIYVPRDWHLNWKQKDIPYAASYLGNMRQLYCTRLAIMFSAMFLLFPKLKTVRISVFDNKPYIHTEVLNEFTRDNWRETLFLVWKKMNKDNYRIGLAKPPPILALGEQSFEEHKGYTA